jgi:hypothetical protein
MGQRSLKVLGSSKLESTGQYEPEQHKSTDDRPTELGIQEHLQVLGSFLGTMEHVCVGSKNDAKE